MPSSIEPVASTGVLFPTTVVPTTSHIIKPCGIVLSLALGRFRVASYVMKPVPQTATRPSVTFLDRVITKSAFSGLSFPTVLLIGEGGASPSASL